MFIREINIAGFRSYRELTSVNNFSPKFNVVVGRNGSGKSNFFYAIQFVLSNEYSHLNQEQRHNILHEGTGNRSIMAKVEIVFDNADRRIPSDTSEVRIMRQVGQKKDQYFIDNKVVTRTDIVNLMESAGFSRSNPYYIVKQGKITELATSADPHRLKLIREVAGTRVFDEKKEESLKILLDTQGKIEKSVTLLSFIDGRLKKLEEEKEDLKEYQKWDKMKRAIEYTIYDLEVKEARSKCDKLSAQRERVNSQQNSVESELIKTKRELQDVETDIRKLQNDFKGMNDERKALYEEQTQCLEKKTQLELFIKDLQDDVSRERSGRDSAEKNLDLIKREVATKEAQLKALLPKFTDLVEKESLLASDIRIAEQKCKELYAKQGHLEHFRTTEERDNYLNREIHFIDKQVEQSELQVSDIERSMEEEQHETAAMEQELAGLRLRIAESVNNIDKFGTNYATTKARLDSAVAVQMENQRQEKQTRDSYMNIQSEITQMEQELRRLTSKAIMNGNVSVNNVLEQFRNSSGKMKKIAEGYHGMVIDLFDCDNSYNKAIEVTAEGRLFYHVVEDDNVAMQILKAINEQEMRGEVNFFPLNRVVPKNRRPVNDPEARPMLEVMTYDEKFDKIFTSVFANTVFVRNLAAGSRVAKSENFDCVTLEGDQVSRRGPMTGGYIDVKRSKLELARKIRTLSAQRDGLIEKMDGFSQEMNRYTNNIESIRVELGQIEIQISTLRNEHRIMTEKQRNISEQLNRRSLIKEPKNAQILQLKNRMRELQAHKEMISSQIGQELRSQLSSSEHQSINRIQDEIRQNKITLEKITKERIERENEKISLENQLQSNLLRKRENLTAKIQDISVEEKRAKLSSEQAEVKLINDRLTEIATLLQGLDVHLTDYEKDNDELSQQLEALQEKKRNLNAQIDEFAKNADIFCTKISSIQSKREDCLRKIREIGSLPTDALGKYQNLNPKQLSKKLTECMNELKKYENVNKKALDQFVRASGQKDELTKRVNELKKNESSIKDLLSVLENRRLETLQLTFKQVAKNFHDVFEKLIPTGRANLIMDTSMEEPQEPVNVLEQFIGIGIQVSFTGTGDTREMSHLSGGQKSLVALALIFAIQKCDPAPFYLFDEIDAALDQEHRKSVAAMIHELSENAQFITTTFRPELLEHAENYYGVRFRNKVSYIDPVTREDAYDFIQDDATHS